MAAFPVLQPGRLPHYPFRGLLSVHCSLRPVCSPSHLMTLYTEDSDGFVASAAAPIATGWSDHLPGGYNLPLKNDAFTAY